MKYGFIDGDFIVFYPAERPEQGVTVPDTTNSILVTVDA